VRHLPIFRRGGRKKSSSLKKRFKRFIDSFNEKIRKTFRVKIRIGRIKTRPGITREAGKRAGKPIISRPKLRIAPRRRRVVRRERGVLTAEVYRTIAILITEGFIFGSLAAVILYVALTGLINSPVITAIAKYLYLSNVDAFLIFLIPLAAIVGFLASDLTIRSQKGISLLAILSRGRRPRPGRVETTRMIPVHPGRMSLATLSLIIPATGLLIIYLFPGQASTLTGALLLGIGSVISIYLFITAIRPPPPLPWYVALATEVRAIKPEETQRLAQLVRTAGVAASPSIVLARYIAIAVIASFLLVPVGVILGFSVYYHMLPFDMAISLITIFILVLVAAIYYPYIKFSQLRGERKRLVERDLPFFAIYASVLQSAGLFLDHALRRLIGNPLFPGMEKEGRIIEKEIRLGRDPLEALTKLAKDHPSRIFRDFIFGYTAVVRSGWDALAYLTNRVREYVQEIKFNWRNYAERVGGLGEILIILFFMTTTLFVLIAVVLPYGVGPVMMVFNFLILPLTTIVMIQSIDSLIPQPKIKDYYKTNYILVGATPFIVLIALSLIEVDPVTSFEVAFISLLLAIGVDYVVQHAEIKGIESALPEFLRDITEYRKIGFPMLRALFLIQESGRTYNKYFNRLLSVINAQLRAGLRLNKVRVPTRSWLGRFVFWLLGEIEDTGGGTPAILEEFTGLITDILESRERARKQLRVYDALAYMTPFFLIIFVAIGIAINDMIKGVLAAQQQALRTLQSGMININLPIMLQPADEAIFHSKISVFVASFLLALTMSKAIDLTLRNTVRAAIIAALSLILIYSADLLGQLMMQMVMAPPSM
jgi:flagellar protein FlaJ